MNWNRLVLVCALGAVVSRPEAPGAAAPPGAGRDLAAEARAVFAARCTRCHGPHLRSPKGRFGYVLDLKRVASNPELVIPSRPDESELWALVRNNEMPPPDAPALALSARQKEAIRAWIAAGAPGGESLSAPGTSPPTTRPENGEAGPPPAPPPARGTLRRFGKFHLLILLSPVALLAAAAAGKYWRALRRAKASSQAVRSFGGGVDAR